MRWTSAVAIYVLFWAFSVFLVLPFGVRTTDEVGGEHIPGQAESAPHEFDMRRLAKRVTLVATILFVLFQVNYHFEWITPLSFDFFGAQRALAR
ncbi:MULTISPECIES: DUF1467 family protein [unclassified Sphingomonas]|uniref:DUF1467 family protein n=1 Tax=unclassified Sphingomonas TaxID=196159 RepID=UPI001F593CBB|nr:MULTISPECIES: DUF1467 family protein [unclassified Sphingomonas]